MTAPLYVSRSNTYLLGLFCSIQKNLRLLMASADGYFYMFDINVQEGGVGKLITQASIYTQNSQLFTNNSLSGAGATAGGAASGGKDNLNNLNSTNPANSNAANNNASNDEQQQYLYQNQQQQQQYHQQHQQQQQHYQSSDEQSMNQ